MADRYLVRFDTTDDPELDGEATLLEDEPHTLDEVVDACRKYAVRAALIRGGDLYATVVPGNERVPGPQSKTSPPAGKG